MRVSRLFLDEETVSQIAERLENIRLHALMHMGTISIAATEQYLNGFKNALHLFGLLLHMDAYSLVVSERGWKPLAARPWREMQARGLSEQAIVDELIVIEAEAWRRTLEIAQAPG